MKYELHRMRDSASLTSWVVQVFYPATVALFVRDFWIPSSKLCFETDVIRSITRTTVLLCLLHFTSSSGDVITAFIEVSHTIFWHFECRQLVRLVMLQRNRRHHVTDTEMFCSVVCMRSQWVTSSWRQRKWYSTWPHLGWQGHTRRGCADQVFEKDFSLMISLTAKLSCILYSVLQTVGFSNFISRPWSHEEFICWWLSRNGDALRRSEKSHWW